MQVEEKIHALKGLLLPFLVGGANGFQARGTDPAANFSDHGLQSFGGLAGQPGLGGKPAKALGALKGAGPRTEQSFPKWDFSGH